jgi:hypothetical protein
MNKHSNRGSLFAWIGFGALVFANGGLDER